MSTIRSGEIERYPPNMRVLHWITALSFVLVALSGLAMFYPPLFWLSNLFGGGALNRAIHPWIGLVMAVALFLLAPKVTPYARWSPVDTEWLKHGSDVVANREEDVPAVGKYNAGHKLVFYLMMTCMVVLLLTGLVIWRAYFTAYFPVGIARLSALLHAFFAFVLICGIVVHVYASIWVKGAMRAMTRGTVSYGWAWRHHRAWFRDVTGASPRK